MRISDWSSDVCSSALTGRRRLQVAAAQQVLRHLQAVVPAGATVGDRLEILRQGRHRARNRALVPRLAGERRLGRSGSSEEPRGGKGCVGTWISVWVL